MSLIFLLAAAVFPFLMMPLMWRRMKKVQRQARQAQPDPAPHDPPWEEAMERRDGLVLTRASNPNEELIALSARARQTRWPIDNG